MAIHLPMTLVFGILGNVVSFLVYLAPLPTFYKIHKRKSTEGFQSVPYVTALFSAMLWIYYALVKTNTTFLVTINSVGCVIETLYIAMYITYAPKKARIFAAKLVVLLNLGVFASIVVLIQLVVPKQRQILVLGWICVGFSVIVFAAPLSIMRLVIRTKSVEYMPFSLSLCLTLSAVMWLCYGLFLKDLFVTLPNLLGLTFGIAQMILYGLYKNAKKEIAEEKLPEQMVNIVKLSTATSSEVHPIDIPQAQNEKAVSCDLPAPNCEDKQVGPTDGPLSTEYQV